LCLRHIIIVTGEAYSALYPIAMLPRGELQVTSDGHLKDG